MTDQIKYIIDGKSVIAVFDIGHGRAIPVGEYININGRTLFDSRFDASYQKLVGEMESGKPLSNYKSSRYYKRYVERLKIDNPEYIL